MLATLLLSFWFDCYARYIPLDISDVFARFRLLGPIILCLNVRHVDKIEYKFMAFINVRRARETVE